MSDPGDPKAQLRAAVLAVRAAVTGDRRSVASQRVSERLLKVPEVAAARVIGAFHPVGSEVDIAGALAAVLGEGRVLALPRVQGDELRFAAVTDLAADLEPGWRGVPEPVRGRCPDLPIADVDVVVVPGVAFDRRGHRLGQGGGHYDRLLRRRQEGVAAVAVAFAEQIIDAIPTEPHDEPVDVIVTDTETLRPGA